MLILLCIPGFIGMIICLLFMLINKAKKKPLKKPIIVFVICFVLCIVAFSSLDGDSNTETEPEQTQTTSVEVVEKETTIDPASETENETLTFELVAGEAGEYGELFTINKDTEFEETYYIYHIPNGTYTVTNTGEYMSQITVYSDEIAVNDAGWEEPAEVFFSNTLDVGKSDTVTVVDGSFVEIQEPAKFTFTATSADAEPEENTVNMTVGQSNALKSANSYLKYSSFSYDGLIHQLEYEQYSTEDATFAADNCGADWTEQALKTALSYLKYSAFSYTGLIHQLEYEKFTTEQATYAADNCGADWNEQAAKTAESYLEYSSFSRDGLIHQLEYEGFTYEQAVYGAEANGY